MWLKTSWTFKGRSFLLSFTKNRRKIERQIENKTKMKKLLAFFFPLQRKNVRWGTTTLMTSSNDNKDSSLPHAASRLVLYTNLKKGQKATDKEREKEQRRKRSRKKQRGWRILGRGMGVRVLVLGLNWPTHLGCCDVLPWVGGRGAVGYGQSLRALWDFSLHVHVFLYVVFSSSC